MFPNTSTSGDLGGPGEAVRERIVKAATEQIFTGGYHGFRMDRLAKELGMSKKTIYVHFPGKEAILDTIAHRLQGQLATRIDRVLEDDTLEFPERLTGVIEGVFRTLRRIRPGVFEEFKRYAPAVFERIDAVRMELIPRVFGQLMREGMAGGYIRQDIDPKFAALAWMQLVRGMTDAEIMDRTGLSPSQTVKQAFELFWPGVLTDSGRQALTRSQPGEGSP